MLQEKALKTKVMEGRKTTIEKRAYT